MAGFFARVSAFMPVPVLVIGTVPDSRLNGLINRLILIASAIAAYSGFDLNLLRTVKTNLHRSPYFRLAAQA